MARTTTGEHARRWRAYTRHHMVVLTALDQALRTTHDLSSAEFELLAVLVRSESGYLRMRQIGEEIGLPQSTTSRTVGRLESAGLVERYLCPDDSRGVMARITPTGRERHDRAAGTYDTTLATVFADVPVE